MRADDIAEQAFEYFFMQQPDVNGDVQLNDLLRRLGVTQLQRIQEAYRILQPWFALHPSPDDFRFVVTKKFDRSVSPPKSYMAPPMTLDNTSFHMQSTPAGREERARRMRERHEREYIVKQNSTFDEVMRLARDGSEAAKLSAQAAIDAMAQQKEGARTSNKIAWSAALAASLALVWTIGHDTYEALQGSRSQEQLQLLMHERDSVARASSHPIASEQGMPPTRESVFAICGECPEDGHQ